MTRRLVGRARLWEAGQARYFGPLAEPSSREKNATCSSRSSGARGRREIFSNCLLHPPCAPPPFTLVTTLGATLGHPHLDTWSRNYRSRNAALHTHIHTHTHTHTQTHTLASIRFRSTSQRRWRWRLFRWWTRGRPRIGGVDGRGPTTLRIELSPCRFSRIVPAGFDGEERQRPTRLRRTYRRLRETRHVPSTIDRGSRTRDRYLRYIADSAYLKGDTWSRVSISKAPSPWQRRHVEPIIDTWGSVSAERTTRVALHRLFKLSIDFRPTRAAFVSPHPRTAAIDNRPWPTGGGGGGWDPIDPNRRKWRYF